MFAIVKTQFGWTVRDESNGRAMGTFTRLLDAAAMLERLNAPACECYPVFADGQHIDTFYCDACRALDAKPELALVVPRAV